MQVRHNVPQISLILKWPAAVTDEAAVRQVLRCLLDARLPATWSISEAAQAQSLAWWGAAKFGSDAALLVDDEPEPNERHHLAVQRSRRIRTRLDQIRAAGMGAAALHVNGEIGKTLNPQLLGPASVQAIIAELPVAAVRPLPLGMWQFTPRTTAPAAGRRFFFFRRKLQWLPTNEQDAPAVVAVDMSRMTAGGSRAVRECETLVAAMAEAQARGVVSFAVVADVAAQLTANHAVKPQRSILRAA